MRFSFKTTRNGSEQKSAVATLSFHSHDKHCFILLFFLKEEIVRRHFTSWQVAAGSVMLCSMPVSRKVLDHFLEDIFILYTKGSSTQWVTAWQDMVWVCNTSAYCAVNRSVDSVPAQWKSQSTAWHTVIWKRSMQTALWDFHCAVAVFTLSYCVESWCTIDSSPGFPPKLVM